MEGYFWVVVGRKEQIGTRREAELVRVSSTIS